MRYIYIYIYICIYVRRKNVSASKRPCQTVLDQNISAPNSVGAETSLRQNFGVIDPKKDMDKCVVYSCTCLSMSIVKTNTKFQVDVLSCNVPVWNGGRVAQPTSRKKSIGKFIFIRKKTWGLMEASRNVRLSKRKLSRKFMLISIPLITYTKWVPILPSYTS